MGTRVKTTEHAEQAAVVKWWAYSCKQYGLPEFALLAIPNAAKRSHALASYLKAEGLRAGVPDLFLAVPRKWPDVPGLWIEMKVHPNKPTPSQQAVILYLRQHGYHVHVCYSASEAIHVIETYLK